MSIRSWIRPFKPHIFNDRVLVEVILKSTAGPSGSRNDGTAAAAAAAAAITETKRMNPIMIDRKPLYARDVDLP
ncbi:uncharacterized protein N7500_001774 [Penicillium coprophilum]|uniref:uncharacterized protein n=1 Tax=Penicillium coprophilum TaxID=36646 RepID=UPI00238ADD42|nr:uncharacterized protein N7500_001774 [Penicillium coprophilum]KAJ5173843.1 hypothetical protein N7500_001774 [Penicillium coprophilum]